MSLTKLLAAPGVTEVCELKGSLGFMAYHGGELEKVTDIVAAEAAERCGASYYGVLQRHDPLVHLPSIEYHPHESEQLTAFFDHVDAVITIHGYGRKHLKRSLLLGGRNREMAAHVAGHLRRALMGYEVIDDLEAIPRKLAGQHADNPVNRPPNAGVQIELPPYVRWHLDAMHWSDYGDGGRAPQVDALIDALAAAATSWQATGSSL